MIKILFYLVNIDNDYVMGWIILYRIGIVVVKIVSVLGKFKWFIKYIIVLI